MSLLSTDITKVKRLSLKEVKLPALAQIAEASPPVTVRCQASEEEILYSKLVAKNPLVEKLVNSLNLVSETTGERIAIVELPEEIEPTQEPTPPAMDRPRLIALAQRVIELENSYSKEDIIKRIIQTTNVSPERAERGFTMMLEAGAIERTIGDTYYLTGSTPF
jgi:hypothetical protein